jgi:hypothetical protein
VVPRSSCPSSRGQPPAATPAALRTIRRATASSRPKVYSATALALIPGRLLTATPCRAAATTSMES